MRPPGFSGRLGGVPRRLRGRGVEGASAAASAVTQRGLQRTEYPGGSEGFPTMAKT